MALDEPEEDNPAAARHRAETAALIAEGIPEKAAQRRAGSRVFGSKPGAYGAGLQAMIDEKIWHDRADLANVYLDWGGHAYGGGVERSEEHTSELQSLMRISYAVFCLKKKKQQDAQELTEDNRQR